MWENKSQTEFDLQGSFANCIRKIGNHHKPPEFPHSSRSKQRKTFFRTCCFTDPSDRGALHETSTTSHEQRITTEEARRLAIYGLYHTTHRTLKNHHGKLRKLRKCLCGHNLKYLEINRWNEILKKINFCKMDQMLKYVEKNEYIMISLLKGDFLMHSQFFAPCHCHWCLKMGGSFLVP